MSRTVSMQFGKPGSSGGGSGGSGGGLTLDLLWTNQNPTSSFSPQVLDIDLSPYTWFAVKYLFQTGYPHDLPLAVFQVDEKNKYLQVANASTNRTGGRILVYSIANKQLTVNAASYNGGTSNQTLVPLEIYGIKF